MAASFTGTIAKTSRNVNSASFSVTMPGSIAAGDGLLAVVTIDGNGTLTTTSTGWVKLGQNGGGTTLQHAVFWKASADGGGSDTLTVDTSVSERATALVSRVTGHSTSIDPDYVGTGSGTAGVDAADPPNNAPSAGSKDYFWVATAGIDAGLAFSAGPSGSSDYDTQTGGASTASTAWATFSPGASSSQDPGVFSHANSAWAAATVAIHPAGASTTPITIGPVALTMTPTVTRNVNRTVSLALTFAPTLSRVIDRRISPTLTLAASISRVIDRKLSLGLTLSPSVTRVVNRTVGVVLTLAASVSFVRALSMVINVAFALNASVSRVVQRNMSAPLTLVPTLSRVVNRSISAALTLVPTVSRVISRSIPVALTLVPNVVRVVERRINAALDLAASVIADFVSGAGNIFPINIEVPLNFAVSVTLGWAGGVAGAARRARTFFFGRRGIY